MSREPTGRNTGHTACSAGCSAPSRNFIEVDRAMSPLPGKVTLDVTQGTLVLHEQAAGGGYGDPLKRSTNRIRKDLDDGKVTRDSAEQVYGVVFRGDGIDEAETARHRERLLASG